MGLLSDIYNTVAKFFRQQDELSDASKSVATNRLKLVLMQDRTNLTPKILEQMRGELIDLLSKYVELDKELLELNFEQEGQQVALMLSIPVIRAKDEEEIEAAMQAESEKHQESGDGASDESSSSDKETCESDENISADETHSEGDTKVVSTPEEINSVKNVDEKGECHSEMC